MSSDNSELDRREEEVFQNLADGAPVMVWMSGLDMGCFYFNRAWLDYRGRTLEQEQGNGWAEGVHPDDLERCVSFYTGCFKQRSPFAMTYKLKDAHGDYLTILDRGAPHFSASGTFLGFYGGCAEIETAGPARRNVEIRSSLQAVASFAQKMASEAAEMSRNTQSPFVEPLQVHATRLKAKHLEQKRERQLATEKIGRLATDMLKYGNLKGTDMVR